MDEAEAYPLENLNPGPHKYLLLDRYCGRYAFDTVYTKAAIQQIEEAICTRRAPVQIAFTKTISWASFTDPDEKEMPDVWGHAELWFGKNVARLLQAENGTYFATLDTKKQTLKHWNLVTIPFHDPVAAFRVANTMLCQVEYHKIGYGLYLLKLVNHVLAQILDVETLVEAEVAPDELDPLNPSTWKHGIFCSQLVLLFLKACVLKKTLIIPDDRKKRRFLKTYTHTCLPADLHRLLLATWPPVKHDKPSDAEASPVAGTLSRSNRPNHT